MVGVRADPGTGSASQPLAGPDLGSCRAFLSGALPGRARCCQTLTKPCTDAVPGGGFCGSTGGVATATTGCTFRTTSATPSAGGIWPPEPHTRWSGDGRPPSPSRSRVGLPGTGPECRRVPGRVRNAPTRVPPPPPVHMAPVVPLTDLAETLPGEQILDLAFAGGWRSSWGGGRLPHGQRATPSVRACCPVGGAQGLEAAQQGLPLRGVGVTAGRDRRASPAADQGTDHCSRRDALAKSASGPFWLVQLRKPPTTPPRPTPLRKIGQWPILIGPAEKTDYCPTLPSQNRTTGRLDGAALSAPDPLRPGAAARDPSGEPGQDLRRDPAQRHLATVGAATLTTAAEVGGPAGVREALKVMLKP